MKIPSKREVMSFLHTFLAVFFVVGLPQLIDFDWQNATKATIASLFIAIIRAVVKVISQKFAPNANSVDKQVDNSQG